MANRPARPVTQAEVTRVEQLTPHMVRVVLGGEELRRIEAGSSTDHYVKISFPRPGVTYPEPFDLGVIRETMPAESWPVVRTYTIRKWRPEVPELWIDFVVHGDEGIAGPWAAGAQPGDPVRFMGPGGGYAPTRPPTGTCWPATRARCPPSPPRSTGCRPAPGCTPSSRSPAPAEEQELETAADARSPGCTAATPRPARPCPARSARWSSRPAGCRRSCTARPTSSRTYAPTCARSGAFRSTSCRSRATGGAGSTRTAGSRPSGEWNQQVESEQETVGADQR